MKMAKTKGFKFPDWAIAFRKNLQEHLKKQKFSERPIRFLEIGVFEGRTAKWLLEKILVHPDSFYVGIDNWSFCESKNDVNIKTRAYNNVAAFEGKYQLIDGDSSHQLAKLLADGQHATFDIIYIDGDHTAYGTMLDSVLSWPLLKSGGFMIWDDYRWGKDNRAKPDRPKIAIDNFRSMIAGGYTEIFQNDQVGIRKDKK
jgi:predicted O-methyltransferase YrrM